MTAREEKFITWFLCHWWLAYENICFWLSHPSSYKSWVVYMISPLIFLSLQQPCKVDLPQDNPVRFMTEWRFEPTPAWLWSDTLVQSRGRQPLACMPDGIMPDCLAQHPRLVIYSSNQGKLWGTSSCLLDLHNYQQSPANTWGAGSTTWAGLGLLSV